MGKEVGRAPEELDAGAFLGRFQVGDDRLEVAIGRQEGRAIRSDVAVMEAIKGSPQLRDELEGRVDTPLGIFDRLAAVIPGTLEGRRPERIGPRRSKSVPVTDAEPQVVAERFSVDNFVGVVVAEGERIAALGSFEWDLFHVGKVVHDASAP